MSIPISSLSVLDQGTGPWFSEGRLGHRLQNCCLPNPELSGQHPILTPSHCRRSPLIPAQRVRKRKGIKCKSPCSALFSISSPPLPIPLHFSLLTHSCTFFYFFPISPCSPSSLPLSASFSLPCSRLWSSLLAPRVTMTTSSMMMAIRIAKFRCHWRLLFSSGINFLASFPVKVSKELRGLFTKKQTQNIPGLEPGWGTQVNGDHSGFQMATKKVILQSKLVYSQFLQQPPTCQCFPMPLVFPRVNLGGTYSDTPFPSQHLPLPLTPSSQLQDIS